MKKERKHYSAEEKVAILRRHLLDRVPVSDLCEELGLRPTVFTAGRRSSSRMERLPFMLRSVPTARWRRSRNGLRSWRRRCRGKSNRQLGAA